MCSLTIIYVSANGFTSIFSFFAIRIFQSLEMISFSFFFCSPPFCRANVFYDFTIFILVDFHSASETHFKRISKSDERYSKCANHYSIESIVIISNSRADEWQHTAPQHQQRKHTANTKKTERGKQAL